MMTGIFPVTSLSFSVFISSIPLEPLFDEGSLPPTVYNVVKDQEYRGEIKVGLTFTPKVFSLKNASCFMILEVLNTITK